MSDLQDIRARLFTALLSDVMDALGHWNNAFPPNIRPLDDASVMVGRARTALFMDVYDVKEGENPYEREIALIDSLQKDEIPVFSCGKTGRIAPWGELLSTASSVRGAAGALMDGLVRDIRAIREMGFPVFHGGIGPLDSKGRGKMMEMDCRVVCGGVAVTAGDWVFGDADGAVVIPQAAADEVFAKALEKVAAENRTRDELRAGRSLREVFDRFGIL